MVKNTNLQDFDVQQINGESTFEERQPKLVAEAKKKSKEMIENENSSGRI